MAISWRYRIAPHEVAAWPESSIRLALGYGEIVAEQMEAARER